MVYTIINLGIHHNSNFELRYTPKLIWVYTIIHFFFLLNYSIDNTEAHQEGQKFNLGLYLNYLWYTPKLILVYAIIQNWNYGVYPN